MQKNNAGRVCRQQEDAVLRENNELNSAQEELQVGPQESEQARSAALLSSSGRWHFLYFFPLPHQQGSFRPGFTTGATAFPLVKLCLILSNSPIRSSPLSLSFAVYVPCLGPR